MNISLSNNGGRICNHNDYPDFNIDFEFENLMNDKDYSFFDDYIKQIDIFVFSSYDINDKDNPQESSLCGYIRHVNSKAKIVACFEKLPETLQYLEQEVDRNLIDFFFGFKDIIYKKYFSLNLCNTEEERINKIIKICKL